MDPETIALLRPFTFHGISFSKVTETGQAIGECPFTGKKDKFYVNIKNMLWDSKVAGLSGNLGQFLHHMGQRNAELLKESPEDQKVIAANRGLPRSAFIDVGIGFDGRFYTIPVRNGSKSSLMDLRVWKPGGKIISTPKSRAWLFGYEQLGDETRSGETVYICEGEWDAVALRWLLKTVGAKGIVLGVPGADIFKAEWTLAFKDRNVVALYDADEAGARGEKKAYDSLRSVAASMKFVQWPTEVPDKFDVRDWVCYGAIKLKTPRACWSRLQRLFKDNDAPVKRDRSVGAEDGAGLAKTTEPKDKLKVIDHNVLYERYRKWLHLSDEEPLAIVFGSCFANRLDGDPLWIFIVAPPGGMKSELIMTLGSSDWVEPISSLTPHALVSGANLSGGGDPSLIPKLNGKVLAVKDFTTILQTHPNVRDEIFGQLRDCYDGKFEKIFGNGVFRRYESRFGIIAGVTPSIDAYASLSQGLGERFLKYRMDDNIVHRDEAARIMRAMRNVNREVAMRKELLGAAQQFLARKVSKKPEELPHVSEELGARIVSLAMLVSRMRGVVNRDKYNSGMLLSKASYEIGTRLAKQITKLILGIAIYFGNTDAGEVEYKIAAKVGIGSVPDRVEELIRTLYLAFPGGDPGVEKGLKTKEILEVIRSSTTSTIFRSVQDMAMLGLVQSRTGMDDNGAHFWSLSPEMRKLIQESGVYEGLPLRNPNGPRRIHVVARSN